MARPIRFLRRTLITVLDSQMSGAKFARLQLGILSRGAARRSLAYALSETNNRSSNGVARSGGIPPKSLLKMLRWRTKLRFWRPAQLCGATRKEFGVNVLLAGAQEVDLIFKSVLKQRTVHKVESHTYIFPIADKCNYSLSNKFVQGSRYGCLSL